VIITLTFVSCSADFDGNSSGDIGLAEFRSALQALGQELTAEQVEHLTADADLDMSGHIDYEEFSAFLQPYMCITQTYKYPVRRQGSTVHLSVTSMGVLLDGCEEHTQTQTIGFSRISDFTAKPGAEVLSLMVREPNATTCSTYLFETSKAESIVTVMKQQLAKQDLRRQVALHKQKLEMLNAFRAVDLSGDGLIDLSELQTLLLSLGSERTDAELRDIMRNDTGDNSKMDFSSFSALMLWWQEEELHDLFDFFDDDLSGSISVSELSIAIHALGEHDGTDEAVNELAACVDSDGSGSIDLDEFCTFLRPMLKITQIHEFKVWYDRDKAVSLPIDPSRIGRRGRRFVINRDANSFTDMAESWYALSP
jgi:calmodulin